MRGKYILTVVNEKKFINHEFGEDSIDRHSYSKWYSMTYTSRLDYVNVVQRKEMEIDDSFFNLGDILTDGDAGFRVEKDNSREMTYKNLYWNAITYEMSLSRHVY